MWQCEFLPYREQFEGGDKYIYRLTDAVLKTNKERKHEDENDGWTWSCVPTRRHDQQERVDEKPRVLAQIEAVIKVYDSPVFIDRLLLASPVTLAVSTQRASVVFQCIPP